MDSTGPMGRGYTVADRENAKAKLEKWRKISIIFGLIPLIEYIILNIIYGVLNTNSGGYGWTNLFLLVPIMLVGFGVCLVMTIISFVRIVAWSRRCGRISDVIIATLAILLTFSPILISKVWTAATEATKISNPYYWSGLGGTSCDFSEQRRVNNVDGYTQVIGCMVAEYYGIYKKYPTESYILSSLSKRYSEISREGYTLVINSDAKPNRTDFVIHYGVNCRGEAKSSYDGADYTNGFAIYSPLYSASYGDNLRLCIDFRP